MLSILIEIAEGLTAVTDVDLRRAAMTLDELEPEDEVLGVVESEDSRRIWALYRTYGGKADSHEHRATFDADTADEIRDARRESRRMLHMSQLCKEMFWLEARIELGGKCWDARALGVRKGWTMVIPRVRPDVRKIFGGMVPFNAEDD